jgi:hypothetical protein
MRYGHTRITSPRTRCQTTDESVASCVMSSRLRDHTQSVHSMTQRPRTGKRDATHHGSTLGTDPWRTSSSTKPRTSNEPVCGLPCGVSVSSTRARNPASTNVRATRPRSQTSPAASIAVHQQRNHQLTPTQSWNIAPEFRLAACDQRKASTATTSATRRKLAAARTILIRS